MTSIRFITIVFLLTILIIYPSHGQGTLTLEDGTELTYRIVTNDVVRPWEVLWGDDGMLWVTERGGQNAAQISRIDPSNGQKTVIYTAPTDLMADVGTAGLLGMAFHPNFDPIDPQRDPAIGTDKLYITYTAGDFTQHLAMMYYNGTSLSEPTTLVQTTLAPSNHGSRLIVTNDEKLLWTTGSDGSNGGGMDTNNLIGKILRVNLDGTIPEDNPFIGVEGVRKEIYSYGHRNPQGLIQVPVSDPDYPDFIYSPEHGSTENDELNRIYAGNPYGWVIFDDNSQIVYQGYCEEDTEGANTCPLVTFDLAPTGALWYDHPAIPEWRRTILMGTSKGQLLVRIQLDETGEVLNKDPDGDPAKNLVLEGNEYALGFNGGILARPRALTASPDGKIYVANLDAGLNDGSEDHIFVIENQASDGCPEDSGNPCEIFTISTPESILICDAQDFTVSIPASVRGATYELLHRGDPTGITLEGTGCALTFTVTPNLRIRNGITLRNQDSYFEIQATDGDCVTTMNGLVRIGIENVFTPSIYREEDTYTVSEFEEVTFEWYNDSGLIEGETSASYTGVSNPRARVSSCGCDVWAVSAGIPEQNLFTYQVGFQFLFTKKISENLDVPWSINYEEDGYLWVTERDLGQVLRINPITSDVETLLTLGESENFDNISRAGLMGLDVNWTASPPEVFVSYTYNDGGTKLRVAKYEYNDGLGSLENASVLVDDIPQTTNFGSDVHYLDGNVYVSTGSTTSQDESNGAHRLDNLIGKILRIDVENPQTSIEDLIYSYGHRNPQGIISTPDGKVYSSEHGEAGAVDEVNLIFEDTNYGWPFYEGSCDSDTEANQCPEWLFGTAPGGITYYPDGDNRIEAFRNTLLVSNLKGQNVSVIELDDDYNVVSSTLAPFGRSECGPMGRLRDITVDDAGNIYLLTNGDRAGIFRLSLDYEDPEPLASTETDIESFILSEQTEAAMIDAANHTVNIEVVSGADLSSLFPTIGISEGATIAPSSGAAQDFTNPFVYSVTAEDGITQQNWIATVIPEPLGLERANDWDIYPNPTGSTLQIRSNSQVGVTLSDMQGRKLILEQEGKNIEMDMGGFAPGIYILQLREGERIYLKKIVKAPREQ